VAGGVKVNTIAVILVALVAMFRGRSHASAFSREIPQTQIQRAMTIVAVAIAFVFLEIALLATVESGFDFMDLFFEGVSAFGTVGLSSGITPLLSGWGHAILMVAMFVGRLGPLTVGLAMAQSSRTDAYRYASERVTIG
jgi:trk system potassium uptake protein TrkH